MNLQARNNDGTEARRRPMVVRVLRLLERELLDHNLDVVRLGERECVLAVLRIATRPATDVVALSK